MSFSAVHDSEVSISFCGRRAKWKFGPEIGPEMAESEFVFDAVIGFLTSPIWNTPVPTFIEQNCLGKGYKFEGRNC